jgi:hypothetical protein
MTSDANLHAPGLRSPPLRSQKRGDLVVEEIKRWIAERRLGPGDKLPKEDELQTLFGVSKGTAREALKSLEVQGLVTVSTGPAGGATIGEVPLERCHQSGMMASSPGGDDLDSRWGPASDGIRHAACGELDGRRHRVRLPAPARLYRIRHNPDHYSRIAAEGVHAPRHRTGFYYRRRAHLGRHGRPCPRPQHKDADSQSGSYACRCI